MVNVLIQYDGTTQYGFLYSTGYGGAAYLRLQEVQIFADTTASDAAGILVTEVSSVGGFVLDFQNGTIAGSLANPLPSGIRMENDSLRVHTYHCEYVDNMVTMQGKGSISADTFTGSFDGVVNMVSIASTFTGTASLRCMIPNGATGDIFNDGVSSRHVAASETGMLSTFDYQPSAFGALVSANINNVTGNGTEAVPVFNTELYDYMGEYNPVNGRFTAKRTGKYLLSCCLSLNVPAGSTTAVVNLNTSNRTYEIYRGSFANQRDGGNNVTVSGAYAVDMDAGDVAFISVVVVGIGADTVDILASTSAFSGQWLSR